MFDWECPSDEMKALQVVTLPYNLLLHRDAREALGIDLTNQVVVIDEAHSECFALQTQKTLTVTNLLGRTRSYIIFARAIHCHAPTGYSRSLLGTADCVHITIQEQIGVKACATPKAPIPPSSHSKGPALKLATAKLT
jgi:hypothetical protein